MHRRLATFAALAALALALGACASERDFLTGIAPVNDDGSINAVVEIPAGTSAKWEVKADGRMQRDVEDGKPRSVKYLGYPANYGMVPRTVMAKDTGGDGDPLDVLVLGDPLERGSVVCARVVAVLELLEKGERDHKLIAVRDGTPFADVRDLADLDERFPGVTAIVETWFTSYKGPGRLVSQGWGGRERALEVLELARTEFADAEAVGRAIAELEDARR